MRKMKMLATRLGSPDGARVQNYVEGESYPMPESLAEAFERAGLAVEVKEAAAASDAAEPVWAMTRKELAEYGKSRFGAAFALPGSAKKADLLAEINRLAAEQAAG